LLVAFHPPLLYLGLVGFTVPFCFAIAGLVTGRTDEVWLSETRRWAIFSWACLTAGLVLGAWWSYQVLGWGGYWSWDPVENSALLPWLTGTAFLHSAVVQQRRGMLRVWNLSLVLATFSLTILGTFFTRSGVLVSVHSFTDDGGVGPALLVFFGLVVAVSLGLLAWRGDQLHSPAAAATPLSRQGAFLANNLLFCAFAFVVLLGTVFPLIVEALNGSSLTVGGPFFDTMTMPIVLCLLFLMAVAPVLPWRAAPGDLLRQRLLWPATAAAVVVLACAAAGLRGMWPLVVFALAGFAGASALRQLALVVRRTGAGGLASRSAGGMIVHLGVVLIAVAFAASHAYQHEAQLSLKVGQPTNFEGHTLVLRGVKQVNSPGRGLLVVTVDLDGRAYYPAIEQFALSNEAVPSPAVRSTPVQDIYMDIASTPEAGNGPVALAVYVEPLVMWLWIGGLLVVAGAVVSMGPSARRRPAPHANAPDGPDAEETIELHDAEPAGSEVGAAV
jgi:cytochrome c-type biogenesis protein CcmF